MTALPTVPPSSPTPASKNRPKNIFAAEFVRPALSASFTKLDPRSVVRNPVMFVVELGAFLTLYIAAANIVTGKTFGYELAVALLLLLTVLFANFAEGLAEARGKAQAASLRAAREGTLARLISGEQVSSADLKRGDRVVVETGEFIPGDGEIVEGIATVDESAITGESAPVIREAGTDHSGVTGGTKVLSDRIVVEITSQPGESFLDRMIALVEGASRQKTPNEIALSLLLSALTLVFVLVVATLPALSAFVGTAVSITTLVALLVCLIPTTIGGLLPAIGIAGMDRALQANVIAKSGKAVEVAGDVDILLLDKTGTITIGDRQATRFLPMPGVTEADLARAAMLSSLADPTPEGRSIVVLARQLGVDVEAPENAEFIEFTAQTRMSGVDVPGLSIRKGAASRIAALAQERGGSAPAELQARVDEVAAAPARPRCRSFKTIRCWAWWPYPTSSSPVSASGSSNCAAWASEP